MMTCSRHGIRLRFGRLRVSVFLLVAVALSCDPTEVPSLERAEEYYCHLDAETGAVTNISIGKTADGYTVDVWLSPTGAYVNCAITPTSSSEIYEGTCSSSQRTESDDVVIFIEVTSDSITLEFNDESQTVTWTAEVC